MTSFSLRESLAVELRQLRHPAESSLWCPWLLRGHAVCGGGAGDAGVLRATSSRHRRWSIPAAVGYHRLPPSLARRATHRPAKREALFSGYTCILRGIMT